MCLSARRHGWRDLCLGMPKLACEHKKQKDKIFAGNKHLFHLGVPLGGQHLRFSNSAGEHCFSSSEYWLKVQLAMAPAVALGPNRA